MYSELWEKFVKYKEILSIWRELISSLNKCKRFLC